MTQFASPATTAQLPPADVNGHLLLIKPLTFETGIQTTLGLSDAVRCDVADLSTGHLHEGVLWFQKVLIASLQTRIGQMVLAVMTQGQPKPGQSPPWILNDAANDPNAVGAAQAWLAQNPTFDPSRPAVASPAPAMPTAPVYQPAPTPAAPTYQQPAYAPAQTTAPAATYQQPAGVSPADV